jgi:ribonuclease HI
MCGYCRDIPETILHVMRDCPLVMPLWLNIVPVNARSWFFSCNVQQWITMNLCKEVGWNREIDWRNYWAMACHCIWSWRIKENHNENYNRPYNPANVVMRSMRTYNLAVRETSPQIEPRQRVVFVSWKPPPVGWVRLNTDGSCRDGGHIGCGGIIRGSDGEWLGGYSKYIGIGSAYLAELWGVFEGLLYARRLRFQYIELHVDSLVVAKAIMSQGNGSWRGRSLVERIHRLLALDWEVVISHTYREANKCADALANYGCSMDSGIIYFDRCPSSISNLLLFDVLGNTTPRVISM